MITSLEGKFPPGLFLWRNAYEEQKETAGKPQTLQERPEAERIRLHGHDGIPCDQEHNA